MKLLIFLRSFLFALLYVPFLMMCSLSFILAKLFRAPVNVQLGIIQFWAQMSCRGCGVVPRMIGRERIPQSGFIALFNHTSFFDIFALMALIPSLKFGAKIELFKIPFFGRAMRLAGALPIDRGNREEVFRIYDEAKERLQNGETFILAPEGTRQPTEKLGPFKAGPFIFALKSEALLLPIVLRGASQILPKNHFLPNLRSWRSEILIEVLEPISTRGYTVENRHELQDLVFQRMQTALQKPH